MSDPQPKPNLPPAAAPPTGKARRPYEPPRIVTHGTLRDLTKNIGLQGSDGITGSRLF